MRELQKSQKLLNKVVSFFEINMDFNLITDNIFLTRVAPYDARLPPERAKDHKDYAFIENSNDRMISANRFSMMIGQRISEQAVERIVNQLISLCSVLKEKPYIQI